MRLEFMDEWPHFGLKKDAQKCSGSSPHCNCQITFARTSNGPRLRSSDQKPAWCESWAMNNVEGCWSGARRASSERNKRDKWFAKTNQMVFSRNHDHFDG